MQIKRFEAKDVQEALRQVKGAMGTDALILSTKTVHPPAGRFGLGRQSRVEVIAALDRQPVVLPAGRRPPEREGAAPGSVLAEETAPAWWERARLKGRKGDEETCVHRILSTGLATDFVQGLMEEVKARRPEAPGRTPAETVREILRSKLMASIDVASPLKEGARAWAFIGPTGVGKTTTLAKLAAQMSLKGTRKIGLISLDTYRIGAAEQLASYGRILGLPADVAGTREELRKALERHRGKDLLLIDTAGHNPRDTAQMEELKGLLETVPGVENHLVLSATTRDEDQARIVERFRMMPIGSYLFTKIDETEGYTSIVNQMLRFKRPLSYLTTGQRVPEDIEPATKSRVAGLVLNQIQWN
jgi:flagellar biosynthesis protein FlhF